MAIKQCRTAKSDDYLLQIIAKIGSKFCEMISEAERKKEDQGNLGTALAADSVKILFEYMKYEVNKELCIPIRI